MPWTRPESVPLGQVWSRFRGLDRPGRPAQNYEIRDMVEEDRKKCLDLMQDEFLRDEPLCKALGVNTDALSVKTIRANWERMVSQHVSLACYVEDQGRWEVVGFNILLVKSVDDEDDCEEQLGEPWLKLLQVLTMTEQLEDVFQQYAVVVHLADSGLVVREQHRGQNIGARLLQAREPLCKALGIPAVTTVFTAKASQVLADRCGYEVLGRLFYKDMVKNGIYLDGCDSEYSELRGRKFHWNIHDDKVCK